MSVVAAPTQLLKGLQSTFIEALTAMPVRNQIFDTAATYVNSTHDDEDYAWIGEAPQVSEFVDEVQFDALSDAEYSLINKKFTAGLQVKRDDLSDETTGGIRQRIMDLAARALRHSEKQLTDALINGDVNASVDQGGGICYDGVTFFNATHPIRGKQTATQSNLVTYTGNTTAQAQEDLKNAIAALMNMLDEAGEPLNEYCDEFYVIYPPALNKCITEAISAGVVSQTSNVQFTGLRWTLIPAPRLTSDATNAYYVGCNCPGAALKALIYQDREPVTFEALEAGSGSDTAFMREVYSYKVRKRSVAGYGRWQRMVKIV